MARMPKYQKLRNARSRAFQRELLQRIDQPKPTRLWTFLNSALFIWFLSASLLTVGGGYITNHQQCMRDADQIISRRAHLASDIFSRNAAFATRVADAKKLRPPFAPGKQGSLYPDLPNIPYTDVERELRMLNERIELEDLPDPEIARAQLRWLDYNSSRADREYYKLRDPGLPAKPDEALKELKTTVELQSLLDAFNRDLDIMAYSYKPDCTFLKTLGAALRYKPNLVKASVSSLFFVPDVRTILKDDADQIDKRERKD